MILSLEKPFLVAFCRRRATEASHAKNIFSVKNTPTCDLDREKRTKNSVINSNNNDDKDLEDKSFSYST